MKDLWPTTFKGHRFVNNLSDLLLGIQINLWTAKPSGRSVTQIVKVYRECMLEEEAALPAAPFLLSADVNTSHKALYEIWEKQKGNCWAVYFIANKGWEIFFWIFFLEAKNEILYYLTNMFILRQFKFNYFELYLCSWHAHIIFLKPKHSNATIGKSC